MTGAELRRARTLTNKTQKQIADETETDKSRICRIEKGMADRMLETYERILKAYGFRIVGPDQEWNEFEEAK
jgi:transcriptional regulator with XRE-family HTH domain